MSVVVDANGLSGNWCSSNGCDWSSVGGAESVESTESSVSRHKVAFISFVFFGQTGGQQGEQANNLNHKQNTKFNVKKMFLQFEFQIFFFYSFLFFLILLRIEHDQNEFFSLF